MNEIVTVSKLLDELANRKKSPMRVLDIMKTANIPQSEFEKYYTWNDEHYTRNILLRNEELEVLLICMEKGQGSPIHDYNAQEAWIHPIIGQLKEERYKINPGNDTRLEKISSVLLGNEEYSYMNHIDIHRYINNYEARSASLNIYAKPVLEWRVYEEETSNSTVVKPWTNAIYNNII